MLRRVGVSIAIVGFSLAGGPALAAERWVGTSTAPDSGGGRCGALTFDLSIDGATVGGVATSPGGRGQIRWQIAGRRDGASVTFDTLHRENVADGRLQQIRWVGRIAADRMELTQNGQSVACATPRTAQLRRP
jgi:hypothetical protein